MAQRHHRDIVVATSSFTRFRLVSNVSSLALVIGLSVTFSSSLTLDRVEAIGIGIFASLLASQVTIDVLTKRLPLTLSLAPLVPMGVLFQIATPTLPSAISMVLGLTTMMAIAQIIRILSRGSFGRGDVYFCAPLGLTIGYTEQLSNVSRAIVGSWFITVLLAGLVSALALISRRSSLTSTIPYGPFLAIGVVATMLLGAST